MSKIKAEVEDKGSSLEFDRTKPTVYVLGAGASHEYGFPLGCRLKDYMRDKMGSFYQGLEKEGEPEPYEVLSRLYACSEDTVDNDIVKLPPEFQTMARRIMVKALVFAERGMIYDQPPIKWWGWYPSFFKLLNLAESTPNAKIITFNYERSLNFFLRDFPQKVVHFEVQKETLDRATELEFIHPYGWVGPLDEYPFGEIYQLAGAESNVTLIHDKETTHAFQDANAALKGAVQVVFIGFGFNQKSVDKLFQHIDTKDGSKAYWTTSVGEIDRGYLQGRFANLSLADADRTANQLMEELLWFAAHNPQTLTDPDAPAP